MPKDQRRVDLAVPYIEPPKDKGDLTDVNSTLSATLPMVAMFTRNRLIGWAAAIMSLQSWLAETPEQARKAATPGYLSVIMSFAATAVTYMPLFLPPSPIPAGTEAEAPKATPN